MKRRAYVLSLVLVGTSGCLQLVEEDAGTEQATDGPTDQESAGDDDGEDTATEDSTDTLEAGEVVWSHEFGGEASHGPVLVDDSLYIVSAGDDSDVVHALTTQGESQWSTAVPDAFETTDRGEVRGIALDSESIYIGLGGDPVVAALDLADGAVRWEQDHWPSSNAGGLTLHDDTLYFGATRIQEGSRQRGLAVVDVRTGDEIAFHEFDGGLHGRPAVYDDMAYFPVENTELVAFDLRDEQLRWTLETEPGERLRNGPTIVDGTLYFGTFGGYNNEAPPSRIYELEPGDGSVRWVIERDDLTPTSRLVPVDDTLYFGSQWSVVSLSRSDGSQQWRHDVPGGSLRTAPVVADGTVYFGDRGGFVVAYDPDADEEQWSYQTRGEVQSPVVTTDRVYAGSADGSLYALYRE